MARLDRMEEPLRTVLAKLECPVFETEPWVAGPPLSQRRIAVVSTAGVHRRGDRPFTVMSEDYRVITGDVRAGDLVMSHVSANFDRSGFQQDWNILFPLDRLHDLAEKGVIGSVADYHYSFMGATDPKLMESTAKELAVHLKNDRVDGALLVPV